MPTSSSFSRTTIAVCVALLVGSVQATADETVTTPAENIDFSSWKTYATMPIAVSDMTVTVVGRQAFVVGGCAANQEWVDPWGVYACGGLDGGVVNTTFSYDLVTGDAQMYADAPRARYRHMAVLVGTDIYVMGGTDDSESPIRAVDVFNTITGAWISPTAMIMTTPVTDGAAFAVGTKIFVCGGYEHFLYNIYNTTQVFDTAAPENGWTTVAPMTTGRGDFGVVAVPADGDDEPTEFLAVGGWDSSFVAPLATTEVYNVVDDTWTPKASMVLARADKALVSSGKVIYVIGGETTSGVPVNDIEYYSTAAGEWQQDVNELSLDRFRFAAVIYDGRMFLFGGQGFVQGGEYGDIGSFNRVLADVQVFDAVAATTQTSATTATTPTTLGPADTASTVVGGAAAWMIAILATFGCLVE